MEGRCWLCNREADVSPHGRLNQGRGVRCAVCGRYDLDETALTEIQTMQGPVWANRHLVSGHLREMALRPGFEGMRLTAESLKAIVASAPIELTERMDRLLLNLTTRHPTGGEMIKIETDDYPLGYCVNYNEYLYFVQQLEEQGILKRKPEGWPLTAKGWERVRELRRNAVNNTRAFVAMSFDAAHRHIYHEAIEPAISEAGFAPRVLFDIEHADLIDDRLLLEINQSRFVVADFTGQKDGVYFEAGYALGQRKTVIWTCHRPELRAAHFNTSHYNHIAWETTAELQEKLYTRIKVLIG